MVPKLGGLLPYGGVEEWPGQLRSGPAPSRGSAHGPHPQPRLGSRLGWGECGHIPLLVSGRGRGTVLGPLLYIDNMLTNPAVSSQMPQPGCLLTPGRVCVSWPSLCCSELTPLLCDGKVFHRAAGQRCCAREEALTFSNPLTFFMTKYSDFYSWQEAPPRVSETSQCSCQ